MSARARVAERGGVVALAPVLFVGLWSTGFLGMKFGLSYAEPFTFLAIRFAITAVVMASVAWLAGARWPRRAADAGHAMAVGLLLHLANIGGVTLALAAGVSAGVVALFVGLQPLITAALVGRLLGERVTAIQWFGLVLGFAGVALVVHAGIAAGSVTALGFAYAAIGLVGITAGTLYQKRFCAAADMRSSLAIQAAAAAAAAFILAFVFESFRAAFTAPFVLIVLWLAIVISIGAFMLLFLFLRRGTAARVTSLFYLTPPVTVAAGFFLFDERLGPIALLGMAVAVVGVALANR